MKVPYRGAAIGLLALTISACGGDGSGQPTAPATPSPQLAPSITTAPTPQSPAPADAGTITLTDSDCQYDPPGGPVRPGPLVLTFVNRTADVGAMHVWRLDEGHAFAEFSSFIAEHHQAFEEGLPDTGPPPFATQVGTEVRTMATDTLAVTADAGTYGIACIVPNESAGRLVATYAAGPVVVGAK